MQYLIIMVGNTMFKLVASEPWQRVLRLPCVAPGQHLEYLDNGDSNEPTARSTYEASAEALRTMQVRHMVGHHIYSGWEHQNPGW